MKHDARTNRFYDFHEKSKSWRILKHQFAVNAFGGTPWESIRFETEQKLIEHLATLPTYSMTVDEEKKVWGIKPWGVQ